MNAMSPSNTAKCLNCGVSWFRSPVLNGEPWMNINPSRLGRALCKECITTIGIEANGRIYFCVRNTFHACLVNIFSDLYMKLAQ